jgi:hypothetical protein
LRRRGYQAIHGDRELACLGDPETGLPIDPPTDTPTALWMSEHHVWDVDKVKALVAGRDEPITFFCGGSRNFPKFIHLFDGVFVLEVDEDVMNRRIGERVALDPTDSAASRRSGRSSRICSRRDRMFRRTPSALTPMRLSHASSTISSRHARRPNERDV